MVGKASRKGKAPSDGPTRERMAKAGQDFHTVFDNEGARVITMRDAPIERMLSRKAIDPIPYTALMKFKHHWYHSGQQPSVGSVDPNRVFSANPGGFSGMAKSEAQADHRQQYRIAVRHIGMLASNIVEKVVCYEMPLASTQDSLNCRNAPQAISGASAVLKVAGEQLARLWGIG